MNKIILITLCGLCAFVATETKGATITAVANGGWYTNSTWSCNCQPSNADNVVIPSGITVSITAGPVILTGGPVITVTIYGTLSLINGGTLIVDSSDIVKVMSGGKISGTGILDAVWSGGVPIFVPNGTSINGPRTITSGSLPITLLFFKGHAEEKLILLEWASASEKNLDFYAVGRSTDGTQFETIGKIKGAPDKIGAGPDKIGASPEEPGAGGNPAQGQHYSFEDTDPLSGVAYYRLQSVDLDGAIETFDLVMVEFESNENAVEIFPNPVIGNDLHAKLNFSAQEGGRIALFDSRGNIIAQQPTLSTSREYALTLPPGISKGLYVLIINRKTGNYSSLISIQ